MLNYTTKIKSDQSIGEISKMLTKGGARAVMQEYDKDGTAVSIAFRLDFNGNMISFRLPANAPAIHKIMQNNKSKINN